MRDDRVYCSVILAGFGKQLENKGIVNFVNHIYNYENILKKGSPNLFYAK